ARPPACTDRAELATEVASRADRCGSPRWDPAALAHLLLGVRAHATRLRPRECSAPRLPACALGPAASSAARVVASTRHHTELGLVGTRNGAWTVGGV